MLYYSVIAVMPGGADPAPMTTSNGRCYDGDATSSGRRYTVNPLFLNGGAAVHDDDDWCGSCDVHSLLQDAPVNSIRQRHHVEHEESITDASEAVDKDNNEKVDLDFADGQVRIHIGLHTPSAAFYL